MKRKLTALRKQYLTALQKHLAQRTGAGLQMALALGQRASGLGLETLDVAKIHERALTALKSPARTSSVIKQAGLFFAETIAPIEETHRAAIQTKARLAQLNKALGRRTVDLAASNRSLKQ